jgi:hypothetical protein
MPPNHRPVKIHRIYSVEDAAHCLVVHKITVRRWIKAGMPVGGCGKTLIAPFVRRAEHGRNICNRSA